MISLPGVVYRPFKGRTLDPTRLVYVYRNLHNGLWSLMHAAHVVGHAETLLLERVTFTVDRAGAARVAATGKRTVCAYAVGYVSAVDPTQVFANIGFSPLRYSIPDRRFEVVVGTESLPLVYAAFARFTSRPAKAEVPGVRFTGPPP